MRNLIELIGLIKGINYDGVINDLEVERLQRWVDANRESARGKSETEMLSLMDEVLEDHIITHSERVQLIQKTEEILKSVSGSYIKIFELNGILAGIICDGIVNENEIIHLNNWLEENESFVSQYRTASRVKHILEETKRRI